MATMGTVKRPRRRFQVEEIDNGWLVKITEAGSDKLIGRYAFLRLDVMFSFLSDELEDTTP